MRLRLVLALAVLVAMVPPAVMAARIVGTNHADRLVGSPHADTIDGLGGNDLLVGGLGADRISAGPGDDFVAVNGDGMRDVASCGTGRDVVNADPTDIIARDCEVSSVQISTDAIAGHGGQHSTEVEPDSFAHGRTVVAVYQEGRIAAGGANAIGASVTSDGGAHWRASVLPGLTNSSPRPNSDLRVTDPSIAYDAAHSVWLAATLGGNSTAYTIRVNRSPNGLSWSLPVTVRQAPPAKLDKDWVACDNWQQSPNLGNCYVSYLDATAERVVTQTSQDGGLTWGSAVVSSIREPPGFEVNGAQPLPGPDGSVVVVYTVTSTRGPSNGDEILASRSTDGGATFQPSVRIASISWRTTPGVRTVPFPSADVASNGKLFVAWQDCRFAPGCSRDRIVLSTSADGSSWTSPAPIGPSAGSNDLFLPGLAVNPASAPSSQGLAVAYYSMPSGCTIHPGCPGIDVWLNTSSNGGRSWTTPQRLDAQPMALGWLANSGGGFVGDYISTSYVGGRPIPVYSLATAPWGGKLRQATMALRP